MQLFSDPGFIELAFVYGLALGFGIWQLRSIQRTLAITRAKAGQSNKAAQSAKADGADDTNKPSPD